MQPYLLRDCFGVKYHQFTAPSGVRLTGDSFALADEERNAELFMELLEMEDAQVVSGYDHYAWKKYAAVTRKDFGKGLGIYFGCMTSPAYLKALLASLWKEKGWWTWKQEIPFPVSYTHLDVYKRQEYAAANDLHGALVYGIGNSTEAVYYLDTGIAGCLVVPDEFNVGYQSLTEAAEILTHYFYKMHDRTVSYTVLRRDTLFSKENQEIIFTMSQ